MTLAERFRDICILMRISQWADRFKAASHATMFLCPLPGNRVQSKNMPHFQYQRRNVLRLEKNALNLRSFELKEEIKLNRMNLRSPTKILKIVPQVIENRLDINRPVLGPDAFIFESKMVHTY